MPWLMAILQRISWANSQPILEEEAEPAQAVRLLFRPVEEWGVFHAPTMSEGEYERRRSLRELDSAVIERAHEMRRRASG